MFFDFFKAKPKSLWTPELQILIDENERRAERLVKTLDHMRNNRHELTINQHKVDYLPGDEYFDSSPWDMGGYVDLCCPNCGRQRVCICDNGKHRCDKCNWVIEDKEYCIEPLDKF